jgi:hypothetical protein
MSFSKLKYFKTPITIIDDRFIINLLFMQIFATSYGTISKRIRYRKNRKIID